MAAEPILMDWPTLNGLVTELGEQVRADRVPDVAVGVIRNGMIPAVILCHLLGVRDLRGVHVTHTVTDGVDAAKTAAPAHHNVGSLGDLTGTHVLIVDDIAGSGDTLRDVVALVAAAGPASVRTAVCVVNQANWRIAVRPSQVVTYIGTTVDRWVIFPWESR